MWSKVKFCLLRPTRVFLGIFLLVLFQDLIATLLNHQQFASSIVCVDAAIRATAGPYLDTHCWEHAKLGDFGRGSAWINAISEQPWQRLVAIVAGALCF